MADDPMMLTEGASEDLVGGLDAGTLAAAAAAAGFLQFEPGQSVDTKEGCSSRSSARRI